MSTTYFGQITNVADGRAVKFTSFSANINDVYAQALVFASKKPNATYILHVKIRNKKDEPYREMMNVLINNNDMRRGLAC